MKDKYYDSVSLFFYLLSDMQIAPLLLQIYCRLWPRWLYHIFPHYLMKAWFSGEKSHLTQNVFWFSLKFCLKIFSFYAQFSETLSQYMTHMTMWRMCIVCWIPKTTNTHSQYVIFTDFLLQQWLHERDSLLRYAYITLPFLL